jgi:hypothetical protein
MIPSWRCCGLIRSARRFGSTLTVLWQGLGSYLGVTRNRTIGKTSQKCRCGSSVRCGHRTKPIVEARGNGCDRVALRIAASLFGLFTKAPFRGAFFHWRTDDSSLRRLTQARQPKRLGCSGCPTTASQDFENLALGRVKNVVWPAIVRVQRPRSLRWDWCGSLPASKDRRATSTGRRRTALESGPTSTLTATISKMPKPSPST